MTSDKDGASAVAIDFPVELADVIKEFQVRRYHQHYLNLVGKTWTIDIQKIVSFISHDATRHTP